MSYDVAIVGAGIVGLAHALAAARKSRKVVVIERDAFAVGASIRNFGFVTVTGQQAGDCWEKARRARDIWDDVAEAARIPVLHSGLTMTGRRPEAEAVLDAFLATEMGKDCRRLSPSQATDFVPALRTDTVTAALYSPHELRVESRTAIPAIAAWLEERYGVDFHWSTEVRDVETPILVTNVGLIEAETVIVCPGDNVRGPFSDELAACGLTRSQLHMLRVMPERPGALNSAVMSDLGLARYLGYAELPEAAALKARLQAEQAAELANGIHLIAVQSADGSLVVGDSHEYGETFEPFVRQEICDLILGEAKAVLDLGDYAVQEAWLGTYASAPDRWRLTLRPDDATRVVVITAGCGASTAFAVAEETISDLFE
jgi:FAD dependent oxidoreductase TIGR03364